jgi:polynucleotide 5'-kinase involved in rRNA processing
VNEHDRLVDRAARDAHTVLFIGGIVAGKSTMARAVAAFALRLGRSVAYLDVDLGQKTVGPPGAVALKRLSSADDLTLERLAVPDSIAFVGATAAGPPLPLVTRWRGCTLGRSRRARTWWLSTRAGWSRASTASW